MPPSTTPPLKIAVLLSGGGTTLENLFRVIEAGELAAQVVLVVSSARGVRGLQIAADHGVPAVTVERSLFSNSQAYGDAIFGLCRAADAQLVAMGGFLKLVGIPPDFSGRVMNIHPSLIPAFCGRGFYGHKVHEAVLTYGAKVSGCTVHFVDNEYDHGPIILQRTVPVERGDTPESLAARVFAEECRAYPEALRLYHAGRLQIVGRRVDVLPAAPPSDV